jgi:hypothetical protein
MDLLRWRGENYFVLEGLADIELHLRQLVALPGKKTASVWIECRAASICVAVTHTKGILRALTFVPKDEVQAVTARLSKAGIQPVQVASFIGPPFEHFFLFPLPTNTAAAALMLRKLFHEVHRLPESAILVLQHRELIPMESQTSPSLRN